MAISARQSFRPSMRSMIVFPASSPNPWGQPNSFQSLTGYFPTCLLPRDGLGLRANASAPIALEQCNVPYDLQLTDGRRWLPCNAERGASILPYICFHALIVCFDTHLARYILLPSATRRRSSALRVSAPRHKSTPFPDPIRIRNHTQLCADLGEHIWTHPVCKSQTDRDV